MVFVLMEFVDTLNEWKVKLIMVDGIVSLCNGEGLILL